MKMSEYDLEKQFCEELDDCSEPVHLLMYKYSVSDLFKSVDPIAFRYEFLAWLDTRLEDECLFEHSDGTIHDQPEEETTNAN